MDKLTGIELKCARLVPSAMFASPTAVVHARGLSIPQKIAILRRWEFDVRGSVGGLRTATAGGDMRLLEEVQDALATLGAAATPRPAAGSGAARH
jgi:hypothetical protein